MFEVLLYTVILACGFPAGLILAKMCKDEIRKWRKKLVTISIICLIIAIAVSFISSDIFDNKIPVIVGLFFIVITSLVIVWKSHRAAAKTGLRA